MKKAIYRNNLVNSMTAKEYFKNKDLYEDSQIVVECGEYSLPVKTGNIGTQPGFYPGNSNVYARIVLPNKKDEAKYKNLESIDLDNIKDISEAIKANESLDKMEKEIMTTPDNITKPKIKESNSPEMVGFKESIIAKNIDIYKYKSRIPNFNNNIRLLNSDNITLTKLKEMCNGLDINLKLTFSDMNGDVVNPMGKEITVDINGSGEDDE